MYYGNNYPNFLLQLARGQVTEGLAMFSLYFKLLCKLWLTLLYYGKVERVFFFSSMLHS